MTFAAEAPYFKRGFINRHGVAKHGLAVRERLAQAKAIKDNRNPKGNITIVSSGLPETDARHVWLREKDCVSRRGLQIIESLRQRSQDRQCGCGAQVSTVPAGQHLPPRGGRR